MRPTCRLIRSSPDRLDDEPRQLPNLSPGRHDAAGAVWRADRPGDLVDGVQPAGTLLGSPGPNVGYALLARASGRETVRPLAPHEHGDDVDAVVAELAMKRAASFGRAPVIADVECADGCSATTARRSSAFVECAPRRSTTRTTTTSAVRTICDAVPLEVLRLAPGALHVDRVADVQAALLESV